MQDPDVTVERVRKMNYDQLIAEAGLTPPISRSTYLYVNTDGDVCWTKIDSDQAPADEYFSIGFAFKLRG